MAYAISPKCCLVRSRFCSLSDSVMTYSKTRAASSIAVIVSPVSEGPRSVATWHRVASFCASAAARLIIFLPRFVSARAINRKVITAIDVLGFKGNCGIQAGMSLPHMVASDFYKLWKTNHTPICSRKYRSNIFCETPLINDGFTMNARDTLSTRSVTFGDVS